MTSKRTFKRNARRCVFRREQAEKALAALRHNNTDCCERLPDCKVEEQLQLCINHLLTLQSMSQAMHIVYANKSRDLDT